jgi:hypothetical protein
MIDVKILYTHLLKHPPAVRSGAIKQLTVILNDNQNRRVHSPERFSFLLPVNSSVKNYGACLLS